MKRKYKKNLYPDGGGLNIINGYYAVPIDLQSRKTSDSLILNTSLPNFQEVNTNQNVNTANPAYGISSEQTNNTTNLSNIGGLIGGIASGIQGMVKGFSDNYAMSDTLNYHTMANNLKNFNPNALTNDDLMAASLLINQLNNPNWKTVRGSSTGQLVMSTVNSTMSGASAGASVGGGIGAIVGAAIGLGSGIAGTIAGRRRAKKEAKQIEKENRIAYNSALHTFDNDVNNVNKQMLQNLNTNYAANGGLLENIDFNNGLTFINNGGTHELNPLDGVPVGIDLEGNTNLVELNEVIKDDYVFSNRLKVAQDMLNKYNLKKGITYALAMKKLSKESKERPNDPISKNGLEAISNDLTNSQEEERMKELIQNINIAACGGKIKHTCGGKKFSIGGLAGMYAPAISSFGDAIISLFEKPNYTYTNTVEDYMSKIPNIGISPTGNYLKKTPLDVNFLTNKVTANASANRRALLNISGGNRATQAANILASDYNSGIQLGNAYRQALELNIANDMAVTDFNNRVNQFNTQQNLAVLQANLLKALQVGQSLYNTLMAKNAERLRVKANKEAAIDNFTANISEVSKELEDRRYRKALMDSGVYGIMNELMKNNINDYTDVVTALENYNKNKKNKNKKD